MITTLDVDLRPRLGTVREQGARPTCLSHAVSSSHEYVRGSSARFSVEYLHYFATSGNPPEGSRISDMRSALERDGQPEDRFCPEFPSDPPRGWKPAKDLTVFRRQSKTVAPSFANVEEAIRATQVPILGISLPRGFYRPKNPWIIRPGNPTFGLHAVVGVGIGFLQDEVAILIRNSWGIGWGESGHALLNSAFLDQHLVAVMILTEEAIG